MRIHDTQRLRAYLMVELAVSYGMQGRRVGDRYIASCRLPGHRNDRTPSFNISLSRNTARCFGCEFRGDVFDFVGAMEGISGFHEQATRLEQITGIPRLTDTRTPLEKDLEQRARAAAPGLAADINDWAHGMRLFAEERKRGLVDTMDWASVNGADRLAEQMGMHLEQIPRAALSPDEYEPRILATAYRSSVEHQPESTARVREHGRSDRYDAERVTWAIVDLLAYAEQQTEHAA